MGDNIIIYIETEMDTKIQELTDKIYREGVEKGNEEANRIISEANTQKQTIIDDAEAEAKRIIAAAEKQVSELKKNTEAELKLFATQSVEALKSEVANLITEEIASSNVKAVAIDKAFMQKVILDITKEWSKSENLTIQASDAGELTKYFESNAKDLLNKGVKIEKVNGKNASFSIIPADGSYKITFGEEEFISFFKEFLRPQLVEMLF
jgi:V/A-type H+-transporting ATPase subunit E